MSKNIIACLEKGRDAGTFTQHITMKGGAT
jgi:hypothetical protein